eukprot:5863459-Amphidinium_carterae.1
MPGPGENLKLLRYSVHSIKASRSVLDLQVQSSLAMSLVHAKLAANTLAGDRLGWRQVEMETGPSITALNLCPLPVTATVRMVILAKD